MRSSSGPVRAGIPGHVALPDDFGASFDWLPEDDPSEAVLDVGAGDVLSDPQEPLALRVAPARGRKWRAALVASVVLHIAGAAFLLSRPDDVDAQIAGGSSADLGRLGNSDADQAAAGDIVSVAIMPMSTVAARSAAIATAEAVERTGTAESAPLMRVSPLVRTEAMARPDVERRQPAESQPAAVAEHDPVATAPTPDRVAARAVRDNAPALAAVAPTLAPAAEIADTASLAAVTDAPPVLTAHETADTAAAVRPPPMPASLSARPPDAAVLAAASTPAPSTMSDEPAPRAAERPLVIRPVADPPAARPKPTVAPPRKAASAEPPQKPAPPDRRKLRKAAQSGSAGANQSDQARGTASGKADGIGNAASGNARSKEAGNAAASNYPGKVASRLRRSLRYPPGARQRGEVLVQFTVSASGSVGSVRLLGSSGSAVLDKAALDAVGRAAPFPPIPPEAGRSTWRFSVPLSFSR